MSKSLVLLGCGDVGPVHEPMEGYSSLVRETLGAADVRFAQCERIYSTRGALQLYAGGQHSRVDPRKASVFKDCKFDVVSVASNHSLDWGPDALLDSIGTLQKLGIKTVGAGINLDEARKPAIIEKNGVTIAVLAYCSVLAEGYAAGPSKAGVAPLRARTYYETLEYQPGIAPKVVTVPLQEDLENMIADVTAAKRKADAVILSVHWGIHYVPRAIADYQRIVMKAAIDAGVDLILGHHAHVPKGIEVYKNKVCFYSLSNFIMSVPPKTPEAAREFEKRYGVKMDPDYPNLSYGAEAKRSLIAKALINNQGVEKVSFLPVLIDKQLRPEVLPGPDARFDDAVNFMDWASEEMPHSFKAERNEVFITQK